MIRYIASTISRAAAVLAVASAASIALASCGFGSQGSTNSSPSAAAGPYVIAAIADQTGSNPNGAGAAAGMQAAARTINDGGGINGHRIEFSLTDAQSTAAGAQTAVRQALQANPNAVVSLILSSNLVAVQPTLASANVPVITGASANTLVYPPKPWLFALDGSIAQQAKAMIEFGKAKLGGTLQGKRVAITTVATSAGDQFVSEVNKLASLEGFTLVAQQSDQLTSTSFTSQAAVIASARPDLIVSVDIPNNHVTQMKALTAAGVNVPYLADGGGSADATFKAIQSPNYYSILSYKQPVAGDMLTKAAEKYGLTTYASSIWFSQGWGEVYVAKAILAKCGYPCSTDQFVNAANTLGQFSIPGDPYPGPIEFRADRRTGLTSIVFYSMDSSGKIGPAGKPVKAG